MYPLSQAACERASYFLGLLQYEVVHACELVRDWGRGTGYVHTCFCTGHRVTADYTCYTAGHNGSTGYSVYTSYTDYATYSCVCITGKDAARLDSSVKAQSLHLADGVLLFEATF